MFITLEGLDGAGKTTLWNSLSEEYEQAVMTREPTDDTWYGDAVYKSLKDPEADPMAELFLYTADHAAHLSETIRPALEQGKMVISDRYTDSRFAYQAATLSEAEAIDIDDPLSFVQDIHQPWTLVPDLTIFVEVSPGVAAERSAAANKFEREEHFKRVDSFYAHLRGKDPERFVAIDGEQDPETVVEEAKAAIERTSQN